MAALKIVDPAKGTQYHVTDAHGNHTVIQQTRPVSGTMNLTISAGSNLLTLSQQNISDFLAALTAFANTGALS